jgi:hypothetical protein
LTNPIATLIGDIIEENERIMLGGIFAGDLGC